jgi:DNA-binding transcriptional MerR regulator
MKKLLVKQADGHIGIGDVAKICGVPVHTIRYWEREFDTHIKPDRTVGKQRRYSDSHIAAIMEIKRLLWSQRFSIKGAKKMLSFQFRERFAPMMETVDFFSIVPEMHSTKHFEEPAVTLSRSVA